MQITRDEILSVIKPKATPKKKIIIAISATVVILAVAAAVYFFKIRKPPINYITTNPTVTNVIETVSASGKLSATNEIQVGSQISGTISEIRVEVNDFVKKGDLLAIINPETIYQSIDNGRAQVSSANSSLKASEATLAYKKWNYEMMKRLHERTNGATPSKFDLENARLDYNQALANVAVSEASVLSSLTSLKKSEIDLKNSIIVSPIDGIILTRSIDVGQTVAAAFSAPLLFLVAENLGKMKLKVNVSEADVGKVAVGQKASFSVDAYPYKTFYSIIYRVNYGATVSNDNVVSYETMMYVENPDLLLRSGMSATANIETARADNATVVPIAALFFNPSHLKKTEPKKRESPSMFGSPHFDSGPVEDKETLAKKGTIWILDKDNNPKQVNVDVGVSDGKVVEIKSSEVSLDDKVIIGAAIK